MVGLLTWPAYGSWFPCIRRGWIDQDPDGELQTLPEPTRSSIDRKERLKWPPVRLDEASSARWFDGWRGRGVSTRYLNPLARARTWLLDTGWRRLGLLTPKPSG